MCCFKDWLTEFSNYSVKAEVKFINDQILGNLASDYRGEGRVLVAIVNFETCKLGVKPAIIDSNNIESNCMILMGSQRT